MQNLRNTRHSEIEFSKESLPLTASAWDAGSDSLICAFGPTESSAVIEVKRIANNAYTDDEINLIASWDAPCPLPDLATDKILTLHYFADTATICLILAGGDLVVVREQPLPGEDLIEIVGSVDAGISAASWSPDEELVAISTRAETLIFMTRDFESIANVTISPGDVKVSAHVSVGWGKKETQFKGKRARALQDPTVPEQVDEGILSSFDRGDTTISWRGDGAYVAVNTTTTIDNRKRRLIRVYTREGQLDSVSEPVDGLEGALSWRPSGNLVTGIQRLEDRIDVVFFERNGLRHGQFSLRLSQTDMKDWAAAIDLRWNSDSSVLVVTFKDRIQLWTMGNYHYYLKQEIMLGAAMDHPGVTWHPEKPLYLSCVMERSLHVLQYTHAVSGGSVVPPNDLGLVAVIDGKSLKLTPLRIANVPPPMALMELVIPENAVDVCINMAGNRLAVLHAAGITEYALQVDDITSTTPESLKTVPLPEMLGHARRVLYRANDAILVLTSPKNSRQDCLHSTDNSDQDTWSNRIALEDLVTSIFTRTNHDQTYVEYKDGTVIKLSSSDLSSPPMEVARLPAVCTSPEVWSDQDRTLVVGLSPAGTLYAVPTADVDGAVRNTLQIRGCTSFLLTPAHLIYTTSQHLLKIVHLNAGELETPADEPEKDERCRSIERGAKLVTVMPSAYSVTLQMPRGNLETIYPRALVLAGIRKSIANKDYKKAFFACRNHRVDMNIIYDYAPSQFLSHVGLFVKQLKKLRHIDLFLSGLREEDVTVTLYKETLTVPKLDSQADATNSLLVNGESNTLATGTSKVNRICDAFLAALSSQQEMHLQNIVTAHVCKSPPDLENGLKLVAKLRDEKPDLVEKAIEHICFLADVNRLYDTALGFYNLDVALLVAQQSQKDPREYLPYLQRLQEMSELRRQFTIDDDLKRYSKALGHLFALDEFEELKTYLSKHELHSQAIELYKYQASRLNELMRIYADFLSSRNRFKDAGLAYEYLSDYASATDAYRAANMWRECLSAATLAPLPEAELLSLADGIAEGLLESKDYYAAATIHLTHLSDVETAIRLFSRGNHFAEALRVLGLNRRIDLLTAIIDPSLAESFSTTTDLLADMRSQLKAQVPRLRELRSKKAADPLAFYDGSGEQNADIPDNISLAPTDASTSAGTFMTRYTNRSTGTLASNATRKTSKNRRREERKRARGKKGSVYEEEYLVNSIGRLVGRANEVNEEVGRLVEGLMRRGMRERAVAVSAAMEEVVGLAEGCVGEVWDLVEKDRERLVAERQGLDGDGAEDEDVRIMPRPVVRKFERLALIS